MPRRPDVPCSGTCGRLLWRGTGSRSVPLCVECRANRRASVYNPCCIDCGKPNTLISLRCKSCAGMVREGVEAELNRLRRGRYRITRAKRLAIYERDEWRCKLCGDPVRLDVHHNHREAPTLDHITPRLHGGDDEEDNLRLAHRHCNSRRGAAKV